MSNALKRAAIALGFAEEDDATTEVAPARTEETSERFERPASQSSAPANVTPLRRAPSR